MARHKKYPEELREKAIELYKTHTRADVAELTGIPFNSLRYVLYKEASIRGYARYNKNHRETRLAKMRVYTKKYYQANRERLMEYQKNRTEKKKEALRKKGTEVYPNK